MKKGKIIKASACFDYLKSSAKEKNTKTQNVLRTNETASRHAQLQDAALHISQLTVNEELGNDVSDTLHFQYWEGLRSQTKELELGKYPHP